MTMDKDALDQMIEMIEILDALSDLVLGITEDRRRGDQEVARSIRERARALYIKAKR
jgi:hypothetical protein